VKHDFESQYYEIYISRHYATFIIPFQMTYKFLPHNLHMEKLCFVLNKNTYSFESNVNSTDNNNNRQTFSADIACFESFINAENIIVIASSHW